MFRMLNIRHINNINNINNISYISRRPPQLFAADRKNCYLCGLDEDNTRILGLEYRRY